MKAIVFVAFVCFSAVLRAQTLAVPNTLTCAQVNYTSSVGSNIWSSLGQYWTNSKWGDNKSYLNWDNSPLTLLRLTYGALYGSISENLYIQPKSGLCTTSVGKGVGSIYTEFVYGGRFLGVEQINGIYCQKWYFGDQHDYFSGRYTLWVTADKVFGYNMPVRYIAQEKNGKSQPFQTVQMDFMTMCTPQVPSDDHFATPTYCPGLSLPVSA